MPAISPSYQSSIISTNARFAYGRTAAQDFGLFGNLLDGDLTPSATINQTTMRIASALAQLTGNVFAGSVLSIATATGSTVVSGMSIAGVGLQQVTQVSAYAPSQFVASANVTYSGNTTITLKNGITTTSLGLVVGQGVSSSSGATAFPTAGTYITAIVDTTHVTVSNVTGSGTYDITFAATATLNQAPAVLTGGTTPYYFNAYTGYTFYTRYSEAPSLQVTAIAADNKTLTVATANGQYGSAFDFWAGDVVLVANVQGDTTNNGNVGSFELIKISSATQTSVTAGTIVLSGALQNLYGQSGSNTVMGNQIVVVQRVPTYGNLTLPSGVTYTGAPFNGKAGGFVLAAVQTLSCLGTGRFSGDALGYRAGTVSGAAGEGYQGGYNVVTTSAQAGGGAGGITSSSSASVGLAGGAGATSGGSGGGGGGGAGAGAGGGGGNAISTNTANLGAGGGGAQGMTTGAAGANASGITGGAATSIGGGSTSGAGQGGIGGAGCSGASGTVLGGGVIGSQPFSRMYFGGAGGNAGGARPGAAGGNGGNCTGTGYGGSTGAGGGGGGGYGAGGLGGAAGSTVGTGSSGSGSNGFAGSQGGGGGQGGAGGGAVFLWVNNAVNINASASGGAGMLGGSGGNGGTGSGSSANANISGGGGSGGGGGGGGGGAGGNVFVICKTLNPLTTVASGSSGATTITVTAIPATLAVGMVAYGQGIAPAATVTNINTSTMTITLSVANTSSLSGVSILFFGAITATSGAGGAGGAPGTTTGTYSGGLGANGQAGGIGSQGRIQTNLFNIVNLGYSAVVNPTSLVDGAGQITFTNPPAYKLSM